MGRNPLKRITLYITPMENDGYIVTGNYNYRPPAPDHSNPMMGGEVPVQIMQMITGQSAPQQAPLATSEEYTYFAQDANKVGPVVQDFVTKCITEALNAGTQL